jgi:hypothetical protein
LKITQKSPLWKILSKIYAKAFADHFLGIKGRKNLKKKKRETNRYRKRQKHTHTD